MPRVLTATPCEVTFYDRISDSRLTLFFDLPTTEERVAYSNAAVTRRGNKIESNIGPVRIKYGAKILRGFKDGGFATEKGLISSDPASPNYDPAWRENVLKYAPDVISMLAVHVFESPLMAVAPEPEDGGQEAPADPL